MPRLPCLPRRRSLRRLYWLHRLGGHDLGGISGIRCGLNRLGSGASSVVGDIGGKCLLGCSHERESSENRSEGSEMTDHKASPLRSWLLRKAVEELEGR
jgi:hypothetical protein